MSKTAEELIEQMMSSKKIDTQALFNEKKGKIIYEAEARYALQASYSSKW